MTVKAELPGISKEDLKVSISESSLRISGEKKKEAKAQKIQIA
jgi:HSP20 family molecular chaperone IbpA